MRARTPQPVHIPHDTPNLEPCRRLARRLTAAAVPALSTVLALGLLDAGAVGSPVSNTAAGAPVSGSLSGPAVAATIGLSTAYNGATLPELIGASRRVKQMVTVTSPGWSSTTGTLKAWHRDGNGGWQLARGPFPVRLGYHGWVRAEQRRQSTGTTPSGRFRMPYAFGRLANPGAHLGYRRFDRNDWWPYEPRDPATYNVWQWHRAATTHWRADKSERLWDYPTQYAYGIVVGFNLPSGVRYSHRKRQWVADHRADTRRGGGIFLHVNGTGPTAGCVSMSRVQMRWLIRWIRPTGHPRLVMGPYGYVTR